MDGMTRYTSVYYKLRHHILAPSMFENGWQCSQTVYTLAYRLQDPIARWHVMQWQHDSQVAYIML